MWSRVLIDGDIGRDNNLYMSHGRAVMVQQVREAAVVGKQYLTSVATCRIPRFRDPAPTDPLFQVRVRLLVTIWGHWQAPCPICHHSSYSS